MKSLKELYRIGKGPSSSHTIGPERACKIFLERNLGADAFKVILYGSLAKTGKGHGTDCIIKETISPVTIFYDETTPTLHPNAMDIVAYKNGNQVDKERVYSVGGGAIRFEHESGMIDPEVYPLNTFSDIRSYCKNNGMRLYEYVYECEGDGIRGYLREVWETMKRAITRGVSSSGILPGGLDVQRRAKILFEAQEVDENAETPATVSQ